MASERTKRLDGLGFAWKPNASTWDELFTALSTYKQKHSDCNVQCEWPDNPKLGKWCAHQRQAYLKGKLPADRIQRLEELGFAWNSLDANWEEMFAALRSYKQICGNCNVPRGWEDNPKLAQWCSRQRKVYKSNELSADRFRRLEEIGFVWDPLVANWEEMFSALLNYKQTHGDFKIPRDWKDNPELGEWCQRQRNVYKNNKLSPERIKRLEDIGFEWDPLDAGWEKMFAALVAYKQGHRDCNVPAKWEGNSELGQWCYVQRRTYRKNKLSAERIQRLEKLGFIWERHETRWEDRFAALVNYKQTHGDCNVPNKWKDDPSLGQWCQTQRKVYKNNKLSPERIKRFEEIGFEWERKAPKMRSN